VYTALDCVIIAISSFMLGVSAFYLLFAGFRMPEKEGAKYEVEPGEAGLESALQVQDADTQEHIPSVNVPETSKAAPDDDRAGLLKILLFSFSTVGLRPTTPQAL